MKLQVVIFLLFGIAKFGICQLELDLTEYDLQQYKDRWSREMEVGLPDGLEINNMFKQPRRLTLAAESKREEAVTGGHFEIYYFLYTRLNRESPKILRVDALDLAMPHLQEWSNFDPAKKTIFITHGWWNSGLSEECTSIRNAYLNNYDVNVIVVQWVTLISDVTYEYAARQSYFIGRAIGKFINAMILLSQLNPNDVTLVGFSMGAHIMGIAGTRTTAKVDTIIGLDPILPLFTQAGDGHGLTKNSAKYVQVIHTNAEHLGVAKDIGHTDLYMLKGEQQYRCNRVNTCSHEKAYKYYARSLLPDPDYYLGHKFASYEEMKYAKASVNSYAVKVGGHPPDKSYQGIYNVYAD